MGPDQHAAVGKLRRLSYIGDPLPDEIHLAACDKIRRAEIGDDRGRRIESELPAELLAIAGWLEIEERVEPRRTGDDNPLRRHAVMVDRLLLLNVIPDKHLIGQDVNQTLRGEVVP